MPDSFQSTDHKEANYNRPDQGWICGGDCHDCPCYLGPDRRGACQAGIELDGRRSGQCLPRRIGARWMCTRQDTHGVPPCEQGPFPDGSCCQIVPSCQPRRSLRKRRGLFTVALSTVTIAVLILTFSKSPGDDDEPSPSLSAGPLSSNHSFIEAQCSKCHGDQRLTLSRLTQMHASSSQHRAIEDGKLCLACHDTIGGEETRFAFEPHSTDHLGNRWKGAGKSSNYLMVAASALSQEHLRSGNIQCATCHQEHHGQSLNLTSMSNRQCQVCHQDQFESFANGHPEFQEVTYPYRRRTGIRFDHNSHYQKHFAEELEGEHANRVPSGFDPARRHAESTSCLTCHEIESSGERMILKSFESSCAGCHEEATRGGDPIPFLAFPSLNTTLLNEKLAASDPPRSIGTWINEAPESLPFATLQLLPADARAAWKFLREKGVNPFDPGLADLDPESTTQLERLAWAIKELARDLSQSSPSENPSNRVGHDELAGRFKESGFHQPQSLIAGLPSGLVDSMRRGFSEQDYIRLLGEVEAYRKGTLPKVSAPPVPPPAPQDPPPGTPENFGEDPKEDFGGDTKEDFGGDTKEDFGGDTKEDFGGDPKEGAGKDEVFGLEEEPDHHAASELTELPPIDPTVWATRGGWYQQYGVVSYRSTGHADPLLKHWLDELARRIDDPLVLAHFAEGFDFRRGSAASSSGQCFKCHSVDEVRDENDKLTGSRINWQGLMSSSPNVSLTRYDHSTHLLLMDCRSCHYSRIGTDAEGYLKAYPGVDDWDYAKNWSLKGNPACFQSSFSPIQKRTCASCHNSSKAGAHCTQCHKYHKPSR